jgi:hypothetical protein
MARNHIEHLRQSGELESITTRNILVNIYGAFLGKCIIHCYGGTWTQRNGRWCVTVKDGNVVSPFEAVSQQMQSGLENSSQGIYRISQALP